MSNSMGLSLEQQFNLRSFQTQVQNMTREQATDFLIKLYEEMLVRENIYKDVLKHQWGL
ncbi:NblA/ycf18 family protein [Geminocystis sp. GBBB08]|uniref:NblA/ycf18 family protein n=1 Tax=Geminocystis sp. GBBB08 TaxID=2604140 RepID=UPI0027E361A6|nr:NblA/ycf18 family protein [Geminocystis sp. GBBB08]MBL1210096.1 NblA-related protein [Geminocystis sp. GBBB08]